MITFCTYPSLSDKLKTDIRTEWLKQKYSRQSLALFSTILRSGTEKLERCRCCHRHHPRCKIVPNRWNKKYTLEGKKCSCPCRHILRQWEEMNEEEEDDWEF